MARTQERFDALSGSCAGLPLDEAKALVVAGFEAAGGSITDPELKRTSLRGSLQVTTSRSACRALDVALPGVRNRPAPRISRLNLRLA